MLLLLFAPLMPLPRASSEGLPEDTADLMSLLQISHRTPREYYWPSGRGAVGQYGSSPYLGPTNLTRAFMWSWHHPGGRFHTVPYGTAIDDWGNIFLTTDTSIWKLSPTGLALWSFAPRDYCGSCRTIFSAGSLLDGRVHFTTLDGRFWAVGMEAGEVLWTTKVCDSINFDNGFVSAHAGVVVAATDSGTATGPQPIANLLVRAVNASDGRPLWSFKPDRPIWNFLALFPGDGTVLYQDFEGRAYRHQLSDGSLVWKAGGDVGSWTDGSPLLGNGVFYTVAARMDLPSAMAAGNLTAHRLSDGAVLWKAPVPMPPNNAPALGRLATGGISVVAPGGFQGRKGGPTGVFAYDAVTGIPQWTFKGPPQASFHQAGEVEGTIERGLAGASPSYVTNPWSAATIDAGGTVYVGHEDGLFFALRDLDGDGRVEGTDEVSSFDTGAAFVGSSGPAHAPGFVAIASCDSLFVFKAP